MHKPIPTPPAGDAALEAYRVALQALVEAAMTSYAQSQPHQIGEVMRQIGQGTAEVLVASGTQPFRLSIDLQFRDGSPLHNLVRIEAPGATGPDHSRQFQ